MKIMILFFLSFLLCGCSVDYHLTIDEQNQIYEEILLKSENELDSQQIFDASWPMKVYYNDLDIGENPEPIEGISYYVNDVFLENNYYQRKFSYTYDHKTFSGVNSILSCYDQFYFLDDKDNNAYSLSTSAEFLCMKDFPNLSQVHVTIEVANPVLIHNASNVHDNIYEWVIDRNNYETSGIVLSFQKNGYVKKEENIESKIILAIILVVIFVFFVFGVLIYKVKKSNN